MRASLLGTALFFLVVVVSTGCGAAANGPDGEGPTWQASRLTSYVECVRDAQASGAAGSCAAPRAAEDGATGCTTTLDACAASDRPTEICVEEALECSPS